MWKCISRDLGKIDAICNKVNLSLDLQEDDFYKDVDIFGEIITWRTLLHSSEMPNILWRHSKKYFWRIVIRRHEKFNRKFFWENASILKIKVPRTFEKKHLQNLQIKSDIKTNFEADDEKPEHWIEGIFMTTMSSRHVSSLLSL